VNKIASVIVGAVFFIFYIGFQNSVSAHIVSVSGDGTSSRSLPLIVVRGDNITVTREQSMIGTVTLEGIPQYFEVTSRKNKHRPALKQRPAFFEFSGGLYNFLETAKDTDGKFSNFDFWIPVPDGTLRALTATHYHLFDNELFYVTEGTVSFQYGELVADCNPALPPEGNLCIPDPINGKWFDAPAGTFLYLPIGRVHSWANRSEQSVRVLTTFTPGGIDKLFENKNVGTPVKDGPQLPGDVDLGESVQTANKFGLVFSGKDKDGGEGLLNSVVLTPEDQANLPSHEGPFGESVVRLVTFRDTGRSFAYSIFSLDPNYAGVDPINGFQYITRQKRSKRDQLLHVLKGELWLWLGIRKDKFKKNKFKLKADSSVYIPAHTPYAYVNFGTEPVKGVLVSFPRKRDSRSD
jgi:quercetin dioxygenase-like cupin family protein